MTQEIDWAVTREDLETIRDISRRALVEHPSIFPSNFKMMLLMMDLTACHCNGCPLNLDALATARDGDFVHDVAGIMRHINRETGELGECFVPRHALRGE